jgi:hypothetical protein
MGEQENQARQFFPPIAAFFPKQPGIIPIFSQSGGAF